MVPRTDTHSTVSTIARSGTRPFRTKFILVHGLRDAGKDELESCVKEAARTEDGTFSYQVRAFRFRASDIFSGKPHAFADAKLKLFSMLAKVQSQGIGDDTAENQSSLSPSSSCVIFIAHGIGSWLVKDVLAMPAGRNLVPTHNLGLIFLDVPQAFTKSTGIEKYQEAVNQLYARSFGRTNDEGNSHISDLALSFRQTDENFRIRHHGQGILNPVYVDVWVSDLSPESSRSAKVKKTSAFIHLARQVGGSLFQRRRTTTADRVTAQIGDEVRNVLDRFSKLAPNEPIPKPCDPARDRMALDHSLSSAPTYPLPIAQRPPIAARGGRGHASARSIASSEPGQKPLRELGRGCSGTPKQKDWKLSEVEGRSFLERGQLKNANAAFTEALKALDEPAARIVNEISRVQIEMQIAIIKYYHGDSADAESCLRSLKDKILAEEHRKQSQVWESDKETRAWSRVGKEVIRWLAACLVAQGKYLDAIGELEKIVDLGSDDGPEDLATFKVKRDLAVAYGLQGALRNAQRTIHDLELFRQQKHRHSWQVTGGQPAEHSSHRRTKSYPNNEDLRSSTKMDTLYATAVVDLIAGNDSKALECSTKALTSWKRQLGDRHVKTLEAARLRAYLLTRTSRLKEAEEACIQMLQILSQEFGHRHQRTLETTGILVYVFRKQRRLIEAIDTGTSLCRIAEKSLPPAHPLMLRLKAELAHCHRSAGEYSTAERKLEEVIASLSSQAEIKDGIGTMAGLRYEAQLAHVYCVSGKLELAQERAMDVLHKQRKLLSTTSPQSGLEVGEKGAGASNLAGSAIIDQVLGDLESELAHEKPIYRENSAHTTTPDRNVSSVPLLPVFGPSQTRAGFHNRVGDVEGRTPAEKRGLLRGKIKDQPNAPEPPRVDPSILYTLRVLASIQVHLPATDPKQLFRLLNVVLHWQGKADVLGQNNPGSLPTVYYYAIARRQFGHHHEARVCFERVFVNRAKWLSISHPDTLSAKRELIVTNCLMSNWRDPDLLLEPETKAPLEDCEPARKQNDKEEQAGPRPRSSSDGGKIEETVMNANDWDQVEICSREIFRLHQRRLGSDHPETLKSLLWVLTIQRLLEKDDCANETKGVLLQRLRSTKVANERPSDAKRMEEHISKLYPLLQGG